MFFILRVILGKYIPFQQYVKQLTISDHHTLEF
jgi:hypothetical protein